MKRPDDLVTLSSLECGGGFRSRLKISRRAALSVLVAASAGGCAKSSTEQAAAPETSASNGVPLRVLLVGEETEAESIRSAWGRTHEKPLDVQTQPIATFRESSDDQLVEWMERVDVAILPQGAIERVTSAELVTAFREETLNAYSDSYGQAFPAAETGLGQYAGAVQGVAVGAKTLAVLSVDPELDCGSWSDYHDWVATLDGKASEPLAPGWAANSFLNRCASTVSVGWLFNRAGMRAEINRDSYVAALEQLASTSALYADRSQTPATIWRSIRKGTLLGGIGYAVSDEVMESDEEPELYDVSVFDCPVETETDRIWFAPQTPIACLSSASRQTDASKRFIGWLSGGEQINSVWQQSDRFSKTRADLDESATSSANAYTRWLEQRLQTRQVMTGLVLPGGNRYYDTLDQHVRDCLDNKVSAAEALEQAAQAWNAITDEYGVQSQAVLWKRALGFGG